jgi:nitroreductase
MNTLQSIKTRKSPDAFLGTRLNREDVKKIAEAGTYAPIFGKLHFTVVEDSDLLAKINSTAVEMMKHSGNDFAEKIASMPGYKALRNAQALVVIFSPKIDDPNAFTMANASCAAENMLLEATELGIGSRFMMGPVMALTQDGIKEKVCIPEGYIPQVIIALGNVESLGEERNREVTNISYIG